MHGDRDQRRPWTLWDVSVDLSSSRFVCDELARGFDSEAGEGRVEVGAEGVGRGRVELGWGGETGTGQIGGGMRVWGRLTGDVAA